MAATGPGTNFPLNAVGQIIEARITHYQANDLQLGVMVHMYRVMAVVGTGSTLGAVATFLDGILAATCKALLSANATYRGVECRVISPAPPSPPSHESANVGVGGVAGDMLPPGSAGLIGLYTTFAGRKFRGRKYMPFPGEADSDVNGRPIAGYVTRLNSLGTQLIATNLTVGTVNNISISPIIWHRATSTYDLVTGFIARTFWASQRRRGDFGRTNPLPF